ncbi:MAG: integral rane protein-like protein [Frankiales bacterium]|nr:integral rane protein-like protein [Frankiales bacterium]
MTSPSVPLDDLPVDAEPAAGPPRSGLRRRLPALPPGVGYCLRVFLLVRAGLFVLGLLAVGLVPQNERVGVPGWASPPIAQGWSNLVTAWERSDALWYLSIAQDGYRDDDGSGAFFPLYPVMVRGFTPLVGGHPLLAAYLVANLALLAGLVLLYRLTELELSTSIARRAVLYTCLFPTGFFLFAPYTESLFLALSVGALLAARRRAWGTAAVVGALAALTRSPGFLLALPIAVEALAVARSESGRRRWEQLAAGLGASAAVGGGLALYLLFWRSRGDWRHPITLQQTAWGKERTWPWETLWDGVRTGLQFPGSYPGGYFTVDALVVLLVLAGLVWSAVRLRPSYTAYVLAVVLLPLFLEFSSRPLLSLPRIYLVAFPVYWAMARFAERWRAHELVLVTSTAAWAVLATMFVSSYPIF